VPVGSATPDDIPVGAPFDAWRLAVLDRERFAAPLHGDVVTVSQLRYLASFALLAPSTHNTVPVRMRLDASASAIHFALDRRVVLPQSDPVARQATISAGAAIANTMLAAAAYDVSADLEIERAAESELRPAKAGEPPLVTIATVVLRANADGSAGRRIDLDWLEMMTRRKMVRAEYDERVRLQAALAGELSAIVRSVHPGLTLHVVSDGPTLLALGKFQELADSTVINRAAFARELADWLLENDSDRAVGMRGREFGLSDAAAARFRAGLAGTGPLLPDETVAFAKSGNLGIRSSSAVAVITVAKDDLAHRLAAGRAFETMTLRLMLGDYCVAMHAGITEVEAPNMGLRGRLRTFERPTVVFRIGKPLRAEDGRWPHASRPALDEVLF
jgi:hypothetical protein